MISPKFNRTLRRPGAGVNSPLDTEGRTALHLAVKTDDKQEARKLLRVGAHPDQPDKKGQGPVFEAVTARNIEMIALLAEHGANLSLRDDAKRTPLDWAIEQKCPVEFIAALERLGADPAEEAPRTKRTAMHMAAEKDRPDVIAHLAALGLPLNQQDDDGNTPLIIAAKSKSLNALKKLMELKADPVIRNSEIETALHVAAEHGDAAIVAQLLTNADVRRAINEHRTYRHGLTPMMVAAENNHAEIVKMLAAVGGDVNQLDLRKRNSLYIAVEEGHVETARALLELGADAAKSLRGPKGTGGGDTAPLVHEISHENYADMLVTLYRAGVDLNAVNGSGQTALNKACEQTDLDKVKALLALGADPNIPNNMGRRPLDTVMDHYSYSYSDHNAIIAELLHRGASPHMSATPEMIQGPLHLAAESGNIKSLELLIAHHAKINETDRSTEAKTPLMAAAERGQTRAAQFLLSKGADLNAKDVHGRTVLHYAAAGGAEELVKTLLAQKGADIAVTDKDGLTPLHMAARADKRYMMEFLLKQGADPVVFDNKGLTPMHHAMVESYNNDIFDAYKAVMGDAAPIDAPARDTGETPLHYAIKFGRQWSVDKLLEMGADPLKPAKDGQLPLEAALGEANYSIIESLIRKMNADAFDFAAYRDAAGDSLLLRAATRNDDNAVERLITAGVPLDAPNAAGETALMVAIKNGMGNTVEMLLVHEADVMAVSTAGESVFELAMQSQDNNIIQNVLLAIQSRQIAEAQKHAAESTVKDGVHITEKPEAPQTEEHKPAAESEKADQHATPDADDATSSTPKPPVPPALKKPTLRLPPPGGPR